MDRLLLGLKGPVSPANPLGMGLTNGFAGRSQLAVTEELGDRPRVPVLDLASPAMKFELSITPVRLGTPRAESHCWCVQRKPYTWTPQSKLCLSMLPLGFGGSGELCLPIRMSSQL